MPDYVLTGVENSKINSDEIVSGGETVYTQRSKTTFGVDGTVTDVGSKTSNPLPTGSARTQSAHECAMASDVVMDNGVERTINHTVVAVSAIADNAVVAAQGAGIKILVHAVFIIANGGANVTTWKSGSTNIGGIVNLTAASGTFPAQVLPFSPVGWFKTNANEALNLALTAATAVQGVVVWSQKA